MTAMAITAMAITAMAMTAMAWIKITSLSLILNRREK
jgi:hypothetical protein